MASATVATGVAQHVAARSATHPPYKGVLRRVVAEEQMPKPASIRRAPADRVGGENSLAPRKTVERCRPFSLSLRAETHEVRS